MCIRDRFNVPISGSVNVKVVFNPATAGTFIDTVVIASNDADEPVVEVALTGTAVNPPIMAISDTVMVHALGTGQLIDSTTFMIWNIGYSDLTYTITEHENVFTALAKAKKQEGVGRVYEGGGAASPYSEVSPTLSASGSSPHTREALWDVQFDYDLYQMTGSLGKAGVCVTNNEIWVSKWSSAYIWRFTHNGTLIDSFTVSGVTGIRALAFDGEFVYAGQNTTTIAKINPATRTQVGTITSPVAVRHISYDPVRNGFWVGNWDTPITCINASGGTIATLTNTLTAKYGSAYDPYTQGGPYLWVWDQGPGGGNPQLVHQFNLNTLTATGVTFDITSVITTGGAAAIAGGLFITDKLVSGKATMVGVLQGQPDRLWGLELATLGLPWADVTPTSGTIAPNDSTEFKVYWYNKNFDPGVYNGYLRIETNEPTEAISWMRLNLTIPLGIGEQSALTPKSYALHQNYPNPFNPTTTIKYDLKEGGKVTLKIYNILGQEVRTLVNKNETAGFKSVVWDGKDNAGNLVSSGLYIYRLETGKFVKSRKMMLLK